MSLLINGIEMPTDHPLWIIVHSDGTVEANEVSASRPVGWQTLRNAAVPVPPHGDLIDRDPFIEFIKTYWDGYDQWFVGQLEARPTIIPAEEGET